MKKYTILFIIVGLFLISCDEMFVRDHQDEKPCPVISEQLLPDVVLAAFSETYPGVTAEFWFDTGNNGYCALFKINGTDTFAYFSADGTFLSADNDSQNELDEDNDNQDLDEDLEEESEDEDCDCERP